MKSSAFKNIIKTGLLAGGTVVAAGSIFIDSMLSKKGIQKMIDSGNFNEEIAQTLAECPEVEEGNKFYRTHTHKEIFTFTDDSVCLYALYYENEIKSNKYVIICHGFTGNPNTDNVLALRYYNMGYNLVMPYSRAHGRSEHNYCTMGWFERFDIISWINYICDKNPEASIVLHGVSMGAATVMNATGETLPENVKCAVADCGFTSVWEQLSNMIKLNSKLPAEPVMGLINAVAKSKLGFDFKEASSLEQVKKSSTPTLFIHGDKDDFVPFEMHEILFSNASCEKESLVVPDVGHAVSLYVKPDLYWSKVTEFTEKYI